MSSDSARWPSRSTCGLGERPDTCTNRCTNEGDHAGFRGKTLPLLMRILIADDDEDGFVPIRASLEAAGYFVLQAFDGEAALELLSAEPFDIGVFDLDMPRLDGASLVREIRARSIALPIILVSGNGNVRRVARELDIEISLVKPFGIDELMAAVEKISLEADASESPPSSGFPPHEATTQIRLRYPVSPTGKAQNDG